MYPSYGDGRGSWGGGGVELRSGEDGLEYVSVQLLKHEIFHHIFHYKKKQELVVHTFLLIFPFYVSFLVVPNCSVYYPVECMLVNYQHPTTLQSFFPSIFLRSIMSKQGQDVQEQREYKASGKESRMRLSQALSCMLSILLLFSEN